MTTPDIIFDVYQGESEPDWADKIVHGTMLRLRRKFAGTPIHFASKCRGGYALYIRDPE